MSVGKLCVLCYEMRLRSREAISRFIREERGDAIQNVMILAVAAVLLVALLAFGKKGMEILNKFWSDAK